MKKFSVSILAVALLLVVSCDKKPVEPQSVRTVCVEPLMTRATQTDFATGDKMGLVAFKDGTKWLDNLELTCSDGIFSSETPWYDDSSVPAALFAYYPYSSEAPTSFSVASDQTSGTGTSDLVIGIRDNVHPSGNAVIVEMRHVLSRFNIVCPNRSGSAIKSVKVKGSVLSSNVDIADGSLTVDQTAPGCDISCYALEGDTLWTAMMIPQNAALKVVFELSSGKELEMELVSRELDPCTEYSLKAKVSADAVDFMSGDFEEEVKAPEFEQFDTYFVYDGETYNFKTMKDGKKWMTENLRYIPRKMTPCSDTLNMRGGIYFPVKVKDDASGLEFTSDEAVIRSNGYLYQTEVALGLAMDALETEQQAKALEGCQGICPPGWHIPTGSDITGLVGKCVGLETDTSAPYFDSSRNNALMSLLNEDEFNAASWGGFSIQDNTKESGRFLGWLSGNSKKITSGMMVGSTFASKTVNPDGKITNFQFYGFMPMTSLGTFNGTKVSYLIASPVRCVQD